MRKLFDNFKKKISGIGISGKSILYVFSLLILVNSMTLILYTVYNKRSERLAYKEEIMTEVMNIIHMSHESSPQELRNFVQLYKNKRISMVVSHYPLEQCQVPRGKYWDLEGSLKNMKPVKKISIQVSNGLWLNFSFHTTYKPLEIQSLIILLETVMAVMLLFFAWYIERFTNPLREFKQAAEQLGIRLTPSPVIEYGPTIVKETAAAMNLMQTRIMNLLNDRTMMLAAISHDLRTPITRIKLQVSMMEDKSIAEDLTADLNEMEQMIDQILNFTREANTQEPLTRLDLGALLMSLVDNKVDEGYQVSLNAPIEKVLCDGKPLALKRAFVNLINNAIKYAKHVWVYLSVDDALIHIIIEDDGPGIPADELLKVFTPFYRIDNARNTETGGSGLGLAISQDIIRHHHGTIHLENRLEGGLRVRVNLPRNLH